MTGPLEVFQAANELLCLNSRDQEYQKEQEGYELVFSALQPGLVPTSSELGFYADNSLGMKPANSLLVPGGMVAETISDDSKIVQAIHLAAQKTQRIVSICSGAFLFAAAGLFNGRRLPPIGLLLTAWLSVTLKSAWSRMPSTYRTAIFYQCRCTAGIDLALALVEDDHGLHWH